MSRGSFAKSLLQFTRAIDRADDQVVDGVKRLVTDHLNKDRSIVYFEVMLDTDAPNGVALETRWRLIDREPSEGRMVTPITEGQPLQSLGSLSYKEGKPLWVVAKERKRLADADAVLEDRWSALEIAGQAPYKQPLDLPLDRAIHTAIVVPLLLGGRPIGVFDLETTEYLEPVQVARQELEALAKALGTVYGLRRSSDLPRTLTDRAFQEMRSQPEYEAGPRLTKPVLFFAWPHVAIEKDSPNYQVVGVITSVLDKFKEHIEVVNWSHEQKSGNISQQILTKILSASYGICYFSEPSQNAKGQPRFLDNPNVLFEAGMLHAICNVPTEAPSGWIPIREVDSPGAPFDFAQERIIDVPRADDGELNEEDFRRQLMSRLREVLDS